MHVAALRVDLRIPNTRSLKEKRHVVRSVIARLEKKFSVSVSEVDHHDLWQRATLGIALVAPQAGQLERLLHSVEREVRRAEAVEVLTVRTSYLERPG